MITMVFCLMTLFAIVVLLPIYLQGVVGISIFVTGLAMLPGGLVNSLVSPFAGRIYDKAGPRPLLIPGIIIMIAMAFLLSTVSASTSIVQIIIMHCCVLAAVGAVMTAAQTIGLNQLPPHYSHHGTAILSTLGQLAGGLGTAIFVTVLSIYKGVISKIHPVP
jgi:DHA2 family lincomycin resistance protein-like MFS transporter